MSKITQALEKAARERLQRSREQVTAAAGPVKVAFTAHRISEIAPAGRVELDAHIVSATDPTSAIAEQYRILRANLQSLRMRPGSKVIVVTSAVNSEGKSVTAVNLALTLARQETLKVALVDADMRKSSVPRWLGLNHRLQGLSTALRQGGELDGSLVQLASPRLAVLPAGPRPEHPVDLLESVAMRRLIASLRTQFDYIIVDAPPLLPVADPGILAGQADGVLLVVRAGRTQRRVVQEALERLKKVKATVLGSVLTHVEYYAPGAYRYYRYYREQKVANGAGETSVAEAPQAAAN